MDKVGADYADFSAAEPWLPVDATHRPLAVDVQAYDDNSILTYCRRFLAWRRVQPALRDGRIEFVASPADVLCFWRISDTQTLLVAINLGASAASLDLDAPPALAAIAADDRACQALGKPLILPAYGTRFARPAR